MAKTFDIKFKLTPELDPAKIRSGVTEIGSILSGIEGVDAADLIDLSGLADELEEAFRKAADGSGILEDELSKIEAKLRETFQGADPGPAEEGFANLAASLRETRDGLKKLEAEQTDALTALRATGQDGTEAYAKLESQLKETRGELAKIEDAAKQIKDEASGGSLLEKLFAFEAVGKAGELLSGIEDKFRESAEASRNLAAATGLSGAALDDLKARATDAFRRGVGESAAEATKAIQTAQQQLGQFLNPQELEDFTVAASKIGKVFDKEVGEVIGGARTFVANFGLSGKEASDLIALGMRDAGSKMDDLLDTTDEYSQLVSKAGFSAEEFVGILTTGVKAGARDTDKLADAIKETQIRLQAGDVSNTLSGLSGPIVDQIQAIVKAGEEGQLSVKEVLQKTTQLTEQAFKEGKIDQKLRSQLQVAVSGTPAEDIGAELYARIFGAPIDEAAIRQKAQQAGAVVDQSVGPTNFFGQLTRDAEAFAASAGESLAPLVGGLGSVLTTASAIGPGLTILEDKFGLFSGAASLIKGKLIPALIGSAAATGGQAVATEGATVAQVGLNTAQSAMPILAIVAGIGLVVGAFALLGDSTKDLQEATDDVNSAVDDFDKALDSSNGTKEAVKSTAALADEYDRLKSKTDPESQARFAEVAAQLAAEVPEAAESVSKLGPAGDIVGETFLIATDQVREFNKEKAILAEAEAAEALAVLEDEAGALVDSYREAQENLGDLRSKREALKGLSDEEREALDRVNDPLLTAIGLQESVKDQQKDVNKEISEESKKRTEAEVALKRGVQAMVKAGKSSKEIQEATGLSAEEVKKFSGGLEVASDKAGDVAGKTQGVAAAAGRAETNVQKLAEAYDKVRQNADSAYGSTFKAVLQLRGEERSLQAELKSLQAIAKEQLTTEQQGRITFIQTRLEQLKTLIPAELKAAKDALAERRKLEREETSLKLQVGEIDFNVTDFTQQAKAVRDEIRGIFADINTANIADELTREQTAIQNAADQTITQINDQIRQIREQAAKARREQGNIVKGDSEFITALREKIVAVQKQADQDKDKAAKEIKESRLQALRELFADELEIARANTDALVESLQAQADGITGNTEEELSRSLALRLRALEANKAQELQALLAEDESYLSKYAELQGELVKVTTAATDEERSAAQLAATQITTDLEAIEQRITTTTPAALRIIQRFGREAEQVRAETLRAAYERELQYIDDLESAALAKLEEAATSLSVGVESALSLGEASGTARIESELARRNRIIQRGLDDRRLLEEDANLQREQAEREADNRRSALAAQAAGVRIEAERQAALRELEIQAEFLAQREKTARELGQTKEADEFADSLKGVQSDIELQASVLTGLTGELGGDLTEAFAAFFTGPDEETVKAPFRKGFQTIAGALQELAAAKITELIIGMVSGFGGIPGAIAAFAARPLINALFSSFLSPVLNRLLSFPTGGRVDAPTFALVGDGARLGGVNREWIFRDDQLRDLVSAITSTNSLRPGDVRDAVADAMSDVMSRVTWRLSGEDIVGAFVRTNRATSRRSLVPITS